MTQIPVERLNELLSYDPITGRLSWRVDRGKCKAGRAISCLNGAGYIVVRIDNVLVRGHRAAWAMHYGAWPDGELDHINRIRSDNRIANLRLVTRTTNMQNIGTPITNQSGLKGVSFDARTQKWRADIRANGKRYNLGRYASKEEAHRAYVEAATKLHGILTSPQ